MKKTILITGATDGIGLATAKMLASKGHNLLIHGRNIEKLKTVKDLLSGLSTSDNTAATAADADAEHNTGSVEIYLADLSKLSEVKAFAESVKAAHSTIDVLINNAGVFKVTEPLTTDGFDVRFMVNTIAPFLLTQLLSPVFSSSSRVINLSSAAQAPVDIDALLGKKSLADMEAYSQSKLAITMWTKRLAEKQSKGGPALFAVNPGSLLASKMVKEGFGLAGNDINIGAKILTRMSLEAGLESHSGQYFDNDEGDFSAPHPDAGSINKSDDIIVAIEFILRGNK